MPEMDGLQATRAIRKRGGRLSSVPIIAFTANAFAEDVSACQEAGMNDFVVKPVRKKVLIATLARAMAAASASTPDEACKVAAPPIAPGQANADTAGEAAPSRGDGDQLHPVIDRAVYDELVEEIGEETVGQMLDVFLEETKALLATLPRLSCSADRARIEREAHSLKSAAGTFGFKRLSALARKFELGVARMSDAEFHAELHLIEHAFDEARTRLPVQLTAAE